MRVNQVDGLGAGIIEVEQGSTFQFCEGRYRKTQIATIIPPMENGRLKVIKLTGPCGRPVKGEPKQEGDQVHRHLASFSIISQPPTRNKSLMALDNQWWRLCDVCPPLRSLNCSLTNTRLEEPVVAADGRTYSAQSLQFFFDSQRENGFSIESPLTHEAMGDQVRGDSVTRALLDTIGQHLDGSEVVRSSLGALQDIPDSLEHEHMEALRCLIMATTMACEAALKFSQQWDVEDSHPLLQQFRDELRDHTAAMEACISTEPTLAQPTEDLTKLRVAFAKLDGLRGLLQETLEGWDPPCITVVGTRSAGKSSVLERLSNVPLFPRNPNVCTRLPIHVRLRQSAHGSARVRLCVRDVRSGEEGPSRFIPFQSGSRYVEAVQESIRAENEATQGFSVAKQIILEVHHPVVPSIDLIDIPGLEPRADRRGPTHEILEAQVQRNRDQGSSAVYLLVVSGGAMPVNDVASAFIEEHNLMGETLGVFTHCDDLAVKAYSQLRNKVEEPQVDTGGLPVGHGWVATMSSDEHEDLPGPERLQRQAQDELEFFDSHHELKSLRVAGNAMCSALVRRLQAVYFQHLEKTWTPRTLLKIDERMLQTRLHERSQYGRPLGSLSVDDRNSAARDEVRKRLDDCVPMVMERFHEWVQSLHKQFFVAMQAMNNFKLRLQDIAEYHRNVRGEGLCRRCDLNLREVEAFWKEEIRSILFAKLECRVTHEGQSPLYRFVMLRADVGERQSQDDNGEDADLREENGAEDELQHLFTCESIRDAHRWLREEGERVQLSQYPVFLENLMREFDRRLAKSMQELEDEIARLDKAAFDLHGPLVSYRRNDANGDTWRYRVDTEELVGKMIAVMMIHGPSSRMLDGLEDSTVMGSEVERCTSGRQKCARDLESLEQAQREVHAVFNLTADQAEDLKNEEERQRKRMEEARLQREAEERRERERKEEEHRQQQQDEAHAYLESRIESSQQSSDLQKALMHLRQLKSGEHELSLCGVPCDGVAIDVLAKLLLVNTSLTSLDLQGMPDYQYLRKLRPV
ncbi:hypothetical protein CYMTET_38228 [Cymbomonas tetramitiformis]|uniref:Dynamin GTPase domain-containing protein n=1 Tax=Cymbomonas tetramitiformis TaxID=36881 RepID=A0AAE0CEI0_9CHLO|nr:hypothetical protein CYMTET_38228 [Cymbomonas tetramitiformis]